MASHAAKEKRAQWALRSNVRDGGHSLQFGDVRVDSVLSLKDDSQRKSRHVATTNFDPAILPSRWTGMAASQQMVCGLPQSSELRSGAVTVTPCSDRFFKTAHWTKSQPNPEQYIDQRNVEFPLCSGPGEFGELQSSPREPPAHAQVAGGRRRRSRVLRTVVRPAGTSSSFRPKLPANGRRGQGRRREPYPRTAMRHRAGLGGSILHGFDTS